MPAKATFTSTITLTKKEINHINTLLSLTYDEIYDKYGLKRDETITHTAKFPDGIEADIKLVICEHDTPYTEGVLFQNGSELTHTECEATYTGTWCFEHNDNEYVVNVVAPQNIDNSISDLRTVLYNAIIGWYDESMFSYNGLDDETFINKVCTNLSITREDYEKLIFSTNTTPKPPFAVTIHYSFDADTAVILFDNEDDAIAYIKEDFEKEKKNDLELGYTLDEEQTYCKDEMAVLATNYLQGLGTTTWTIANVVEDKR